MMLSTLFPPDPSLTVDNVSRIMEKVEPNVKRMQVWNDASWVTDSMGKRVRPIISLKEDERADLYVNCHPRSSWEHFAGSLYHHHQMIAVEEVRSYLPPRGEPFCGIHESNMYMYMYMYM